MEFHEKLQTLRRESGMSQEDLAEQLGVSRQAVSNWENGQGFPETDKLIQIANLFGASLDYLLKEDRPTGAPDTPATAEPGLYVNRETVEGFLLYKRQSALRIAIGVALLILSVVPPILLGGVLGPVLMFLLVASGVAILISSSFRGRRYEQLSTQPLLFDVAFLKSFRARYYTLRKNYGLAIAGGVFLIILGLAVVILASQLLGATWEDHTGAFLFLFTALGVAIIVYAAVCLGAHRLIAENETHMTEQRDSHTYGWIYGVLMPLAVIAFFIIGITTDGWQYSWLPFPIAALLGTAIVTVLRNVSKKQ